MVRIPASAGDTPLLTAVRTAIRAAGGRPVSLRKFLATSGLRRCDIFRHYTRWDEILRAAGFRFDPPNKKIDQRRLLADWARVARKLRHIPSRREYQVHGRHDPTVLARRLGSWGKVPAAFRAFATRNPKWSRLLTLLPPAKSAHPTTRRPSRPSSPRAPRRPIPRLPDRPACGDLLNFGPLLRAPVNESGVTFLFALLAGTLGFQVESLQTAFPDCEAKRRHASGIWQTTRIEFEYESRNFRDHGHDPRACDLIICWTHNWPDCPENLEVISLHDELQRLAPEPAPI